MILLGANKNKIIFRVLLIGIVISVQIFGQSNISGLVALSNKCKVIGGNTNELEYIFSNIKSIAVNSESDLFVLDGKGNQIKKYSSYGDFIENIGQKGKGPSDLSMGRAIAIDSENNIFVYDKKNMKIVKYNSVGSYKKTINVYEKIKNFKILKNGNIVALTSKVVKKTNKLYWVDKLDIYTEEFEYIRSIDSMQLKTVSIKIGKNSMTSLSPFQSLLLWGTDRLSNIYVVDPSEYLLKKYNENGLKLLQNKYNCAKYYVSETDREQYFEEIHVDESLMKKIKSKTKFPDVKPFVNEMLVTEDGKIYLKRTSKNNSFELIDVFTAKLKFQTQRSLSSTYDLNKSLTKNGLFFLVSSKSVEFPFVKICKKNK